MIDSNEGRDVMTVNVVGVYLSANMDNFVTMKIEEMIVDVMVKVDPGKHWSHVRTHNDNNILYVNIVKALYRCIKSGLLWYNLFSETLRKIGFMRGKQGRKW